MLSGESSKINPTNPVYDREAIVYAQLDLGRIAEESMALDVTGHYARPDCFQLVRVSR